MAQTRRRAGAAAPARRDTAARAGDLAGLASNLLKFSDYASEDSTRWRPARPARPAATAGTPAWDATSARGWRRLVTIGRLLLIWVAGVPRRLGDRLFVMNDAEAAWRGWQTARTHGGLGRRYRDPWFDTLAECATCRETGRRAGPPGAMGPGAERGTSGGGSATGQETALADNEARGKGVSPGENQPRGEVG